MHFSTKKKHDQFWSSFLFLPFSLFCLKMAKICVFAFQKAKQVGRTRGLRQFPVFARVQIQEMDVFAPKLIPPKYFMYWHQGCVNTGYTATVSIRRDGAKVRIQNCEGANTYFKNNSSKIFSVLARVRIQAPHVFVQKLIPQDFFPACIGFVPGGNLSLQRWWCINSAEASLKTYLLRLSAQEMGGRGVSRVLIF